MELTIEKKSLTSEIQKEFNTVFPYLKIEFYKPGSAVGKKVVGHLKKDGKQSFGEMINGHFPLKINIDSSRTVGQLEKDFWALLGLGVKLFRKSGSLWIETTLTENWTLGKQNLEGELLSKPITHDESFDSSDEQWMDVE
jgi:hypothetical protein